MKGGDLGETQPSSGARRSRSAPPVLIPESYVADLQLRLGLYRRLSTLETRAEIDAFAAELVDRFGELPEEVKHLLDVVEIKGLCRQAGVAAGRRGPEGRGHRLPQERVRQPGGARRASCRLRAGASRCSPTSKLVFKGEWDLPAERLKGVRALVAELVAIAVKAKKAA